MTNRPAASTAMKRDIRATIAQIVSVLDDRNVLRAMHLLQPVSEGAQLALSLDQPEGPRCVKCITRGE